jgi:hypothetical protein
VKATRHRKRVRALHVSVTGHRPNRMPERQWRGIKRNLAKAMAKIESENPGRPLVLVTGLAEGADRLAAFVALGRGWSLHAILAFHRSRFEKDFPDPYAIGEFRALLEASAKVEEPDKRWHARKAPERGYEAVGEQLLKLSDILIAIWDGKASRGKGGTVEVIKEAQGKNIPVYWLHATKAQGLRLLQDKAARSKARSVVSTRKKTSTQA